MYAYMLISKLDEPKLKKLREKDNNWFDNTQIWVFEMFNRHPELHKLIYMCLDSVSYTYGDSNSRIIEITKDLFYKMHYFITVEVNNNKDEEPGWVSLLDQFSRIYRYLEDGYHIYYFAEW